MFVNDSLVCTTILCFSEIASNTFGCPHEVVCHLTQAGFERRNVMITIEEEGAKYINTSVFSSFVASEAAFTLFWELHH